MNDNAPITTNLYAVRDSKTGRYDIPFAAHNDLFAKRKFTMDITHEGTMIHDFAEDFELWHVSD